MQTPKGDDKEKENQAKIIFLPNQECLQENFTRNRALNATDLIIQ